MALSLLDVFSLEEQGVPPQPGPVLLLLHLVLQLLKPGAAGQEMRRARSVPPPLPQPPGQTVTTLGCVSGTLQMTRV